MKTLTTDRLILRELNLDDLDSFFQYAKKPNIGPNAGWKPHESIDESLKILRMMIHEDEVWCITLKSNRQMIGTIGLHVRNFDNAMANRKEIGYVLDDTYWGQGLMVEAVNAVLMFAFYDLELDEVICGHMLDNIQSKRVIEKTHFTYTHEEERDHYDGNKVKIKMYRIKKNDYAGDHK
jgi:[ribosomal protein S5]-alanine N-acetyltransferase